MELSKEIEQALIMKLLGLSDDKNKKVDAGPSPMIGKVCMIRTYSAGVHFGEVVSKNGQNIVLKNAHRVHYWAKACSLSQLAMEGDKQIEDSRISMAVDEIELDRCIEVIPLGNGVFEQLTSKIWKA